MTQWTKKVVEVSSDWFCKFWQRYIKKLLAPFLTVKETHILKLSTAICTRPSIMGLLPSYRQIECSQASSPSAEPVAQLNNGDGRRHCINVCPNQGRVPLYRGLSGHVFGRASCQGHNWLLNCQALLGGGAVYSWLRNWTLLLPRLWHLPHDGCKQAFH